MTRRYVPNLEDIESIAQLTYDAFRSPWLPRWVDAPESEREAMATRVETILDAQEEVPRVVHPPDLTAIEPFVLSAARALCITAETLIDHLGNP